MRTRRGTIALCLALGMCSAALAQQPDETGTHAYAGQRCSWASFADGYYIEMEYREFRGRVQINDPDEGVAAPFVWRMQRPDGTVTSRSAPTARNALNGLCGAMIVAHEEARPYDRETAFRDLLSVLDGETGPARE